MRLLRYGVCLLWGLFGAVYAGDISGIYLTHKGTEGGQAIVEIFKHNGKFYVYGLKNLEAEPVSDSCNKNVELRGRKSVGVVFGYGYTENKKGQFVDGAIYNFYNCKTYHGKIVPKGNDKIDFVGALDSYYVLSKAFEWQKLSTEQSKQYQQYRLPLEKIAPTIDDTIRSRK